MFTGLFSLQSSEIHFLLALTFILNKLQEILFLLYIISSFSVNSSHLLSEGSVIKFHPFKFSYLMFKLAFMKNILLVMNNPTYSSAAWIFHHKGLPSFIICI